MLASKKPIRTLQVEDNPGDARLMYEFLYREKASDVHLSQVDTLQSACKLLESGCYDVVLLDLSLPDACGLEAVHAVLKQDPEIAVVVVSSHDDELTAITALQSGAQDYIVKGKFDSYTLHKSIRYALERKKIKERLSYLAQYDALTGLLNRESFLSRVSEAVERSIRSGDKLAVFFIDMDKFKQINDSLGHAAGDDLLKQVTARFEKSVRKEDFVARLAGDEFAILLESMNSIESSDVVADKLFDLMKEPFCLAGTNVDVTISIGITVFTGNQVTTEEALKQADIAMYKAKRDVGNSVHYYDHELEKILELRHLFKDRLNDALNEKLLLEYQPQVDSDNKLIGVETLLRWQIPSLGIVYPEVFMPFLEDTGSIVQCGEWVLEESCTTVKRWYDENQVPDDLKLSVNVSAKQIKCSDFVATVQKVLERTQFPHQNLVLEITESTLMEDSKRNIDTLNRLNDIGVSFSIDDFGTGYSSLSYLSTFPFSSIKIDQSFVQALPESSDNVTLVKAIIGLAKSLGKEVIAEGVETWEQRDFLNKVGCNKFQGYLFSKPMIGADFIKLSNVIRINKIA